MAKFIKSLQLILLAVIGCFFVYDFFLRGVTMFNDKYVIISAVLTLLLEISLWVIYQLTIDD
ncbi:MULTISPECIES: hypothetical protein [unclassified Vibrio]|uniref:Uncharacterized protein n=1 Tax=Vibrio sp. HB236076 TaxID=3232307 RepID=A0AB39HD46_9VIBR|nr:hypothetical protein [Vibrio sp. HB161653]MDP5253499.1 hypothetical protein [Vibrio sp. HB161653]